MMQAAVYFNEIPNDGLVPAQVLPAPFVSVGTSVAPRNQ
jgi:cell division protein FtsW (lipid II flippase)